MSRLKFSNAQIEALLRRVEAGGITVTDACKEAGISRVTYYNWQRKFAADGEPAAHVDPDLEAEVTALSKQIAEIRLDIAQLKEAIRNNPRRS